MKWTRTKPTEVGFYWLRNHGYRPEVVAIENFSTGIYVCRTLGSSEPISKYEEDCEWCGPISAPA